MPCKKCGLLCFDFITCFVVHLNQMWEASRLAASGGVASSGHPVDGSAQGGRRRRWPVQFRFVHGVRRPITPGPVFGHVAERARLA